MKKRQKKKKKKKKKEKEKAPLNGKNKKPTKPEMTSRLKCKRMTTHMNPQDPLQPHHHSTLFQRTRAPLNFEPVNVRGETGRLLAQPIRLLLESKTRLVSILVSNFGSFEKTGGRRWALFFLKEYNYSCCSML